MALVPRGPGELEPYGQGLIRSQQRRIEARFREATLEQRLSAEYYREEERNRHEHTLLVADNLADLDDHIESKIAARKSPRREDALEELYADTKNLRRCRGCARHRWPLRGSSGCGWVTGRLPGHD